MTIKYTNEDYEYAQKLREKGLFLKQVSEITGISIPTLEIKTVFNNKAKQAQKRIKEQQIEIDRKKLIKLVEGKYSHEYIADEFGIKKACIYAFAKRLGVKLASKKELDISNKSTGDLVPGTKVEFVYNKRIVPGFVCETTSQIKNTYIIDMSEGRVAIAKNKVREVSV